MKIDPVVIGAIIVCFIIFIFLGKSFLRIVKKEGQKMTEQDLRQSQVDNLAAGTDAERWQAVGRSAREAGKKGGCIGKLIVFAIIIVVLLALFDAFFGNGEIIKSIMKGFGR